MRLERLSGFIFLVLVVKMVSGAVSLDPIWLYSDIPDEDKIYSGLQIYDTCRTQSIFRVIPETDPAGSYNQTEYINFEYQFNTDTIKVVDRFDTSVVLYSDYRPGYAGFKIDWDNGITTFPLAKYKYLVISHMGPLEGHKVIIRFGWNSGCGSITTFNEIGSFASSATWKRDSIRIPDEIRSITAEEQLARQYYEMQIIINNVSPDGSPTSAPGVLKIDDIALEDTSGTIEEDTSGTIEKEETSSGCGCGTGTGVALLPPMLIKAVAWRRRRRRNVLGNEKQA